MRDSNPVGKTRCETTQTADVDQFVDQSPAERWAADVAAATAWLRDRWDQLSADEREAAWPAIAAIDDAVETITRRERDGVRHG